MSRLTIWKSASICTDFRCAVCNIAFQFQAVHQRYRWHSLGISYKHSQTTYSQKPHINNIKQQRGETLLEANGIFCWHASLAVFWPATLLTLAAKSAVPSHTDVSNLGIVVRSRKIPRCALIIFCSCFPSWARHIRNHKEAARLATIHAESMEL